MANLYGYQFQLSYEPGVVTVFGVVDIGAVGAPTLNAKLSRGIASVSRASAGKYNVVLKENFYKFLHAEVLSQSATGISAAPNVGMISAGFGSGGNKTLVIQCSTGGVATDPASGETLYLKVVLKNVSA